MGGSNVSVKSAEVFNKKYAAGIVHLVDYRTSYLKVVGSSQTLGIFCPL